MMELKTFAYLAFTALCIVGAAAMLLNPPRSKFDEPWPTPDMMRLAADAPQPAAAPGQAGPAPAVLPTVAPPAFAENPAAAALAGRLGAPARLDGLMAPDLAQRRDLAGKVHDASARPVVTPLEVRRKPVMPQAGVSLPPLPSRADAPPLAAGEPVVPGRQLLAVLPRYAVEDIELPLPPLRVALAVRPRPESLAVRGHGILNLAGNADLHIIPPLRSAPAPSVRALDALEAGYPSPLSAPPPDDDPPVSAQVMPPKPPLK
jgi:hypothetical protein